MLSLFKNSIIVMMASFVSVACAQQSHLPETYSKKVLIEAKWGGGPGEFGRVKTQFWEGPTCFTVDAKGNIYIMDYYNARIQCFNPFGERTHDIGLAKSKKGIPVDEFNQYVNSKKTKKIYYPGGGTGLAVDNEGNLYISEKKWDGSKKETTGLPIYYVNKYNQFGEKLLTFPLYYESKGYIQFGVRIQNNEIIVIPGADIGSAFAIGTTAFTYKKGNYPKREVVDKLWRVVDCDTQTGVNIVNKYDNKNILQATFNVVSNSGGGAFYFYSTNNILYQMTSSDNGLSVFKYEMD